MVTPPHEVPGDVSRTVNIAIHDKIDDKFYLLRGKQGQLVIYEIENPVEVFALEKTPLNVKELQQLVDEDVPECNAEYPPLLMAITAPDDGTHYAPDEGFDIVYVSVGGLPPRTCGLRISDHPIANDVDYNAAAEILAEGGPDAGTVPTVAPHDPDTYYIRGRVTDAQPLTALSNQVTIIVDAPGVEPVWFLTDQGMQ